MLAGLIVIAIFPHVYAWIASSIQTANTPGEIKQAYEDKKVSFNKHFEYVENLISSKVVTDKVGETKTSVCYIKTEGGGGWTIAGYSQVCYLRVTAGYYTDLARQVVQANLLSGSLGSRFLDEDWTSQYPKDCRLSDYESSVTVRYVNKGNAPSTLGEYDFLDHEECGRPSSAVGVGSENRTLSTDLSIKDIEVLDERSIDDTRNQVWLEIDYEYFNQSIVCKPVIIPILSSCGLSRSQPVQ